VALIGARRQRFGSIARSLTGELKRRKLALYLKLEFTFAQLYDRAKIVDERFTFPPINESWYFKVADIEIKEPLELEEAWAYLDIFPSTTIAEIRSVRNSLRGLQAICDGLGDQLLEIKPDVENPIGNEISGCASEIWMACEIVNAELNPLIERLAPAIPLNDRMIRIYAQAATNASRTIRLIDGVVMMFVHWPERYLVGIIQFSSQLGTGSARQGEGQLRTTASRQR
jgi:hypothetical protein